MNFTGERVIPGEVDADLFNEHWARYLFASGYAAGRKVLDVACGSGYGSALLARSAAHVTGADVAPQAVEYALRHYASPKTQFVRADGCSLPFGAARFDLVVAFEIIEHIGNAAGFLNELRRVLAPGGLLLISTPNRLYYTEDRGEVNPFHEREYSFSEFAAMLQSVFPHCSILLENHVAGLLVADSHQAASLQQNPPAYHQQDGNRIPSEAQQREREAYYMIALCSAGELPPTQPFLFLPSSGNVLRERESHIHRLEELLSESRYHVLRLAAELEERSRWAQELDRRLAEKDAYILQLQADYDQKVAWAKDLDQAIEKAQRDLDQLQKEFGERTAWALRLSHELEFLQSTRWYRIGRKLRVPLDPPATSPTPKG